MKPRLLGALAGAALRKAFVWVAVGLSAGTAANAAPVTWNFTAIVSIDYNSPLNLGDTVSGSITFDTATPASFSSSTQARYNNALTSVSLAALPIGALPTNGIGVYNNASFVSHFDLFSVDAHTGFWPTYLSFGLSLYKSQSSGYPVTAITSLNLPTTPYDLSTFASSTFNLNKYTNGNSEFSAQGYLTSLTLASAVPEPATWAMILLGFAGVGFAAYRRGRNSVRWV
jgi:hypothetical protein